jgi:hypothetical protein
LAPRLSLVFLIPQKDFLTKKNLLCFHGVCLNLWMLSFALFAVYWVTDFVLFVADLKNIKLVVNVDFQRTSRHVVDFSKDTKKKEKNIE